MSSRLLPHVHWPHVPGPILASGENGDRLGNYSGKLLRPCRWPLRCQTQNGSWGGWLRRPSLNCRLRDERPNRNAFTSIAAARPIVQARDYNLARSIKLSAKTRSVYSIHNRWLRLLRAAVINWMLVLHVSMSVEQSSRKMQGEFEKMQRGANRNRAKTGPFWKCPHRRPS